MRTITGISDLTETDRQNLINSGNEIREDLDGFVSGNELVINTSLINTPTQARLFAAHEILSHVGLRARYGADLNRNLDTFYRQLGGLSGVIAAGAQQGVSLPDQYGELVARAGAGNNNRAAQRALVQEVFAAAAENNTLQPGNPVANGLSDFVSRVKGFFARFPGLDRIFGSFTERDIMRVVRESRQAARRTQVVIGPVDTAASIGGVARRANKIDPKDRVINRPDGSIRIIKNENRFIAPDGTPVRQPNTIQEITNPVAEGVENIKQSAIDTARTFLGNSLDQVRPSTDPLQSTLRRTASQGRVRRSIGESETLIKLQEAFADSKERIRRTSRDVFRHFGESENRVRVLADRIRDTLDNVLTDVDADGQLDLFSESERDGQFRRVQAVRADLEKTLNSNNFNDIHDAINTHQKQTAYVGKANEQSRDTLVDHEAQVAESIDAVSAMTGLTPKQAEENINVIAEALSSIEKNNAIYLTNSPVNALGQQQRQVILDRINLVDSEGGQLTQNQVTQFRQQLEQIGREHFSGMAGATYESAREDTNTTGLSTKSAREALADFEITAENLGVYTGSIDTLQRMQAATNRMRAQNLPQSYWNERRLHGFRYDFPVAEVDLEAFPLLANVYTQRGYTDFQSESERKSQLTGKPIFDVGIQARLVSQENQFNNEVARSLVLNTLASEVSPEFKSVSNNVYETRNVSVISKNDQEFRDYVSNNGNSQNLFYYSVPNSDAAVRIEFDGLSNTPKQIRGERKLEELREWTAFKAARTINGAVSLGMTRYNANFIPRSHVREFLTAGLFLTAEQGLGSLGSYLSNTLDNNLNMPDIYNYMRLRNTSTAAAEQERQALLQRSPVVQQLQELIEAGGLVTQLSALTERGQQQITNRNSRNPLVQTFNAFDNWFGTASDATDAIVRLSAYQARLADGATKQQAADYAKRLANFESRGKYSGPLGDMFIFYNPSAVGASRFLEAVTEGEYARPAMIAAAGAGLGFGLLAAALSGEDEDGNKLFDREGLDRQTADIRIPLSGDTTFALPAGFSPMSAAFLFGNQMAGFVRGQQDVSQLASNTLEIMTNNFSPVPASGIPLVDSQGRINVGKYIGDTITPSAARPVVQFWANMNGLGLPIYRTGFSNASGGLTDAFNGRESDIGTWSERLAVTMHEASGGAVDVNPGTLRHFMSSYFNAVNTVLDFGAEAVNLTQGVEAGHSFVDRSLGFGGFFSRTGHSDEYYQTRRRVDALSKQIKTYETTGRTELAQQARARLPGNFDEIITAINRNKRAQDVINTEMRPVIYGTGTTGQKREAIELQNERRRQLQREGLELLRQIIPDA